MQNVYLFLRVAVIKCHTVGGLQQQKLIMTQVQRPNTKIGVWVSRPCLSPWGGPWVPRPVSVLLAILAYLACRHFAPTSVSILTRLLHVHVTVSLLRTPVRGIGPTLL